MLAILLPARCGACGAPGRSPCPACAAELRPAPPLGVPVGLDTCAALLSYEGTARQLVASLKFRNHRGALGLLASALAELVDRGDVGAVTWAPTSPHRRRRRGFDQAEVLAVAVAAHVGPVAARSLLRRRPGPVLTGRPRAERLGAPRFEPIGPVRGAVVVVDDVVTTGSTLAAAAAALRRGGADRVHGLALAATPLKASARPADTHREGQGQRRPP